MNKSNKNIPIPDWKKKNLEALKKQRSEGLFSGPDSDLEHRMSASDRRFSPTFNSYYLGELTAEENKTIEDYVRLTGNKQSKKHSLRGSSLTTLITMSDTSKKKESKE